MESLSIIESLSKLYRLYANLLIIEIESIVIIEDVLKVHWLSIVEELSSKLKDA